MVSNPNGGGVSAAGEAVAGTVKDKAGEVSSATTDQAGQLASSAADQARRVTGEAADQARNLLDEATDTAWRQGEAQTEQIASALGRLRDQAAALIDGRPQDAPALTEHGRAVVDRMDEAVRRLETGGLQGAVQDVQGFARRRPVAFLVGAGLLGLAAGRAVRAGRDSRSGGSGPGANGDATGQSSSGEFGGRTVAGEIPPRTPAAGTVRSAYPPPPPTAAGEPTVPIPSGGYRGSVPPPPPSPPSRAAQRLEQQW